MQHLSPHEPAELENRSSGHSITLFDVVSFFFWDAAAETCLGDAWTTGLQVLSSEMSAADLTKCLEMQHNQLTLCNAWFCSTFGTAISTDAEVGWGELGLFGRHLLSLGHTASLHQHRWRKWVLGLFWMPADLESVICETWIVSCGYYQHMLWNGFTCSYLESFAFSWKARCARSLKIPFFPLLSHYLERKGRNFEIFIPFSILIWL